MVQDPLYYSMIKKILKCGILTAFIMVGLGISIAKADDFLISPPVVGDGTTFTVDLSQYAGLSVDNKVYISHTLPAPVFDASAGFYFLTTAPCPSMCTGWGSLRILPNYETYYITDNLGNNFYWTSSSEHFGGGGSFYINGIVATSSSYIPDSSYSPYDTHIISMTPEEGTTTTNTVNFTLHAYINPNDLSDFTGVKITFHNIDQNILLSEFSKDDIFFLNRTQATSSGDFYFASTTNLADGDYRVTAELEGTTLFGVINPLRGTLGTIEEISHQFIVNQETFLGHISQNSQKDLAGFYASSTATTSAALAGQCNPLGGNFGIRECMTFLFIPDAGALSDTLNSLRKGILQKAPIGYATRIVDLIATSSTTALPVVSYTWQSDSPLAGKTLTLNENTYFAQAAALNSEMTSNTDHKTVWDIFAPIVKFLVYTVLIFAMIHDVTGIRLTNHRK